MEIKTKEFTVLTPFSIINKEVQVEDKTRDDVIKIAGYANWAGTNEYGKTYIDLAGDVVVPSGVDTSVWELNPQILWQHDRDDTIGEGIVLEKRSDGIYIECFVHKGAMDEKDWYRIKNGLVKMFSVGFRTLDYEWKDVDGDEVFFITKCLLLEVSCVSIPANSKSGFSVVKSLGDCFTSSNQEKIIDDSKSDEPNNTQEDALMNIKVKRADLLSASELETFKQLGGDVDADVEVTLADFIKGIVAGAVADAFAAKAEEEAKAEEAAKEVALEAERVVAEAKAAQEAADAEQAAAELSEKEAKELKEINEIKELVASLKAVVAEVK